MHSQVATSFFPFSPSFHPSLSIPLSHTHTHKHTHTQALECWWGLLVLICNVPHVFKISAEASVLANLCKGKKKCLYANGGWGKCSEVLYCWTKREFTWEEKSWKIRIKCTCLHMLCSRFSFHITSYDKLCRTVKNGRLMDWHGHVSKKLCSILNQWVCKRHFYTLGVNGWENKTDSAKNGHMSVN